MAGQALLGNGRYQLRRPLGQGGYGAVFVATDRQGGDEVAIKLVPLAAVAVADRPAVAARLRREAAILGAVQHPRVPRLLGVESLRGDDGLALVQELVQGAPLSALLRGQPVQVPQVLRWLAPVATLLAQLHQRHGVIHRDLKPANLLVPTDDEQGLYVVDFGVARASLSLHSGTQLQTGDEDALGTPRYRAPEQHFTPTLVDGRADVFSLGLILYEALAGCLPYPDHAQLGPSPPQAPSLSQRQEAVPAWLDELVRAMLAQDREARPAMGQVATALAAPASPPFPGGAAFGEQEAALFFGRQREIAAGLAALTQGRWLLIDGGSGSGKASLIRAGLLPRARELPGVAAVLHLNLGEDPLLDLAQGLLHARRRDGSALWPAAALGRLLPRLGEAAGLRDLLREALRPGEALLLALELRGRAPCAPLALALGNALADSSGPLRLLIGLPSEEQPRLLALPALAQQAGRALALHLKTPAEEELRQALLGPAALGRVSFEPGLCDHILGELRQAPGALPLLASAARALYEGRRGDWLTWVRWRELGGVGGVAREQAERALERLDTEETARARRLLPLLWRPGRDGPARLRPLPIETARLASGGDALAERVLCALCGLSPARPAPPRLLVLCDGLVTLVHAALPLASPTLMGFLEAQAPLLRRRDELEDAAARLRDVASPVDGLPQGAMLSYYLEAARTQDVAAPARLLLQRAQRRQRQRHAGRRSVLLTAGAALLLLALATWQARHLPAEETLLASVVSKYEIERELGYYGGMRAPRQLLLSYLDEDVAGLARSAPALWPRARSLQLARRAEFARSYLSLPAAEGLLHDAPDRESPAQRVARGRLLLQRGMTQEALTLVESLPPSPTGAFEATRLQAEALLHLGRPARAAALLQALRLAQDDERQGKLLADQAQALAESGDRGAARQRWDQVIPLQRALVERNAGYSIYARQLAHILTQADAGAEEALGRLKPLVTADPDHRDLRLERAAAARRLGVTLAPRDPRRAAALLRDALDDVGVVLARDGEDGEARHEEALCLWALRPLDPARAAPLPKVLQALRQRGLWQDDPHLRPLLEPPGG